MDYAALKEKRVLNNSILAYVKCIVNSNNITEFSYKHAFEPTKIIQVLITKTDSWSSSRTFNNTVII